VRDATSPAGPSRWRRTCRSLRGARPQRPRRRPRAGARLQSGPM